MRHHRILDDISERRRGHDLAQAGYQPIVGGPQLGADAAERRTGGIEDFAAFADGILDVFDQARVVAKVDIDQLKQSRRLVTQWRQASAPGACAAHRRRHPSR